MRYGPELEVVVKLANAVVEVSKRTTFVLGETADERVKVPQLELKVSFEFTNEQADRLAFIGSSNVEKRFSSLKLKGSDATIRSVAIVRKFARFTITVCSIDSRALFTIIRQLREELACAIN